MHSAYCGSQPALSCGHPTHTNSIDLSGIKLLCMLWMHSSWVIFAPCSSFHAYVKVCSSYMYPLHVHMSLHKIFKCTLLQFMESSWSKHTYTHECNVVTVVLGSLRLAPITMLHFVVWIMLFLCTQEKQLTMIELEWGNNEVVMRCDTARVLAMCHKIIHQRTCCTCNVSHCNNSC